MLKIENILFPTPLYIKSDPQRSITYIFFQSLFYIITIFSSFFCSSVYGQTVLDDNSQAINFEMQRSQVKVYTAYLTLNEQNKNILSEADSLAGKGEYEISLIYLEEVLASLRELFDSNKFTGKNNIKPEKDKNSDNEFNLSFLSGVDFDQHEFEFDYEQSDSTILEEISKPYIGINTEYVINNTLYSKIGFYNSLRYDKQNLRNDYQVLYNFKKLNLTIGGYYNKSFNTTYSSYWEHKIQGSFTSLLSKNFKIFIRENFSYKIFSESEYTYTDYYRNFIESMGELYLGNLTLFSQYNFELNEFLGNSENDYQQHKFKLGYRKSNEWQIKHSFSTEVTHRKYSLIYGGNEYLNDYLQLSVEADIDFRIIEIFNLRIEEQFIKKIYNQKSMFEPDYIWNFVRPALYLDLINELQFGIGYEWELKNHNVFEEGGVSSTEQNYNSNGLFLTTNYFTESGTFLSFSSSYQWRRYPESPTNDLINLYASRNILSLMLMGSIPLFDNLKLNILGMYDNDDDIDSDQGRTQSSIFNVEFEYRF